MAAVGIYGQAVAVLRRSFVLLVPLTAAVSVGCEAVASEGVVDVLSREASVPPNAEQDALSYEGRADAAVDRSSAPVTVAGTDGAAPPPFTAIAWGPVDTQSTFGCVLSAENGQTWADMPTPFPETGHLWNALFRAESGTLFVLTGGQLRRAQLPR
jgi:ABC-type amino acid transport substrate-binding protein